MQKLREKILVVDENQINRQVFNAMLGEVYEILEAESIEQAINMLNKFDNALSAILFSIGVCEKKEFCMLQTIHDNFWLSQIPVLVFSDKSQEDIIMRALELGAVDVITRPFCYEIVQQKLTSILNLRSNAMRHVVQCDSLTGLYNRNTFFTEATKKINEQDAGYYVMACFNIDNFKLINNQYGMAKGDAVLKKVAQVIFFYTNNLGGICARFAADNFALLYPYSAIETGIFEVIDQEIRSQDALFSSISVSVGRYRVEDLSLTAEAMYDRALLAMSSVKRNMGQKIALYSETMRTHMLLEQEITNEMKAALLEGQFEVWLQPQYNHAAGTLIGAEALIRWRHPVRGLIMPMDFIPLFEKNGFIFEMDKYVWEQCCGMIQEWINRGLTPLPISVNISPHDLLSNDFCEAIIEVVEKYEIPAKLLHLGINTFNCTESLDYITKIIQKLIDYGFLIEIDDLKGGFSATSILKDIPAQILRLDMRNLDTKTTNRTGSIIESVIRMAKWLGMAVIAEGIEDKDTADFLQSIGCYYVQGLFYSPAIEKKSYDLLLAEGKIETELTRLETVQMFDNTAFWDPKSIETLIFNSYVGGACVFEYYHGKTELLRVSKRYEREIGMNLYQGKQDFGLSHADYLDRENQKRLLQNVEKVIRTNEESTCELMLVDKKGSKKHLEYILITLRVIAKAGERYLFYCVIVNTTQQHVAEKEKWNAIRKQAEMNRQLNIIMENINAGVCAVYLNSKGVLDYIYTNDRFYQIYGYTKEQFETEIMDSMKELILPEYYDMVQSKMSEALEQHTTVQFEYKARKRDGSEAWIRVKTAVCYLETQKKSVHVNIYNDVSKEKQATLRVRELNEKLSNCEIFVQLDITKKEIEKFNSMYATPEETIKFIQDHTFYEKYMKKVVYGKEYKSVYNALSYKGLMKHYKEGDLKYSVEYRKKIPSGEVRWFAATAVLIEERIEGSITAFIYSRDIDTKMKRRIAKNRIVDAGVEDITIINIATATSETIAIYYDSAIQAGKADYYTNLEQYLQKEVAKEDEQLCRDFFSIDNLIQVIDEKGYADESYWITSPNGYNRRKNARITYLDSTHEDLLMVGRDITELFEKEQERQMILQQAVDMANYANRAKSDFLSRMSHDMRTPLNAIIGLTQLEKGKKHSGEILKYIKGIDNSSQYLLELVNDNLDLSKIESGKMELHKEPFTLEDFILGINTVIKPLMEEKHIDFVVNLRDDVTSILVDKMRFTQVFYNLLSNAAKYTSKGGRVEFYDEVIPERDGKYGMRFFVKDDGIGMSEEYQKVLFEPFSQEYRPAHKERKGTGLGLAIVKQIIDLSGGNIEVVSKLNKGTTFIVDIYAKCLEADAIEMRPQYDVTKLEGLHVMVVDDNEINRVILCINLESKGCIVSNAEDGEEAVNAVKASEDGYYDVILTDINMPVMDGLEEAKQIRALPRKDAKDIIIIAATADAYSDIFEKIREAGMNGRIIKPIMPDNLYQIIVKEVETRNIKDTSVRR